MCCLKRLSFQSPAAPPSGQESSAHLVAYSEAAGAPVVLERSVLNLVAKNRETSFSRRQQHQCCVGRYCCRLEPVDQMSALCTPRRAGRAPLRPVTPMGQDLPEDTPSKIRARNAAECAEIRRRQVRLMTEHFTAALCCAAGDPRCLCRLYW